MNTVGNFFKSIGTLHAALCAGAGLCILLLRYMGNGQPLSENAQVLFCVGLAIAIAGLVASRVLFFRLAGPARQLPDLNTKLTLFRSGFIVQMALLEGSSIINIILWYMGGNTYNLGISLGLLFLMIYRRPARTMVRDIIFNPNEDSRVIFNDEAVY